VILVTLQDTFFDRSSLLSNFNLPETSIRSQIKNETFIRI